MYIRCKFAVASLAMFTGVATPYADPVQLSDVGMAPVQIAAAATSDVVPNAIALQDRTLYAPDSQPYTSGFSTRGGSANTVRAPHFQVWAGYDSSVTLHPYTSNLGPGTETVRIQPSRYERTPFTD